VRICFHDEKVELETDEDGYFEAMLDAPPMIDGERWHEVRLELLRPRLPSGDPVEATGAVVIPTRDAEFGVISDLDDTVVRSGAYNRLQMGRIVLLNSAN